MLALGRRKGEKTGLFRNGELLAEITVIQVKGCRVKLGFSAPADLTILRGELYEAPDALGTTNTTGE